MKRVEFIVKSKRRIGEYTCKDAYGRLLTVARYEIRAEDGYTYYWSTNVPFEVGCRIRATLLWSFYCERKITRGTVIAY